MEFNSCIQNNIWNLTKAFFNRLIKTIFTGPRFKNLSPSLYNSQRKAKCLRIIESFLITFRSTTKTATRALKAGERLAPWQPAGPSVLSPLRYLSWLYQPNILWCHLRHIPSPRAPPTSWAVCFATPTPPTASMGQHHYRKWGRQATCHIKNCQHPMKMQLFLTYIHDFYNQMLKFRTLRRKKPERESTSGIFSW